MTDKENATVIGNRTKSVTSARETIQGLDFASVWSGPAYESTIPLLNTKMSELKELEDSISLFQEALTELGNYKEIKSKISSLSSELSSIPNTKENSGRISSLQSEISSLTNQANLIRESINSKITTICGVEVSTTTPGVIQEVENLANEFDLIVDINSLKKALLGSRIMSVGDSLYNYYSRDYVLGVLQNVQNKYTGREAAVNSVLAVLKLGADKGVRMNYQHRGTTANPYVSTDYLVSGVDCNPFVSWCVDKGTPGGFQWRPVGGFKSVGTNINYSDGQPGDVLVAYDGYSNHHVMFVIANDPDKKKITVAHSAGTSMGMVIGTRSYNELSSVGYSLRDMTNVYNGTENTNRKAFENSVDWSTFQRPL